MNTYAVHRGGQVLATFYSARTPDDPTIQAEMEQVAAEAMATWSAAPGIVDPATFVNPADSTGWPEGATCWKCGDPLGPDEGVVCDVCGGAP
jgi:hypothetical protein